MHDMTDRLYGEGDDGARLVVAFPENPSHATL
jgi:hypothetical protein